MTSTANLELRQQLVATAKAMVPAIRGRVDEAAALGRLPDATVAGMQDAGFFKIMQPARYGGLEMKPHDFFDVQITLAEGCMSTAWVLGVVAIHNWQLGLFDDRAQQDVWGEDDSVLISSSYMPVGKVTPVEGGYKLSGHWGFSSGSKHCDWAFLGAMVPPVEEGGTPDYRTFLVPRSDYEILDNWNVSGLEGTGSHDIVVKEAFVPEYRTHRMMHGFECQNPGNAVNDASVFHLPFGQVFAPDGTYKSPSELRAAFGTAGIDWQRPVVTTCGSGVTASVLLFAMHLAGKEDTALYDGSWSEWAADPDAPKAQGPK